MSTAMSQGMLENELLARRGLTLAEAEAMGTIGAAFEAAKQAKNFELADGVLNARLLLMARWPAYAERNPVE